MTSSGDGSSFVSDNLSDNSLFAYTSGRFLFNENLRLRERYVELNVHELKATTERAVGCEHGVVANIRKLAEGGFNRILLLTMEDGFEVIAKIPYLIAQPAHYATANEAATLAFLKNQGFPVPNVLGYSAESTNPVGSEYILMEKAPGVSVADRWQSLTSQQIRRLAHNFVQLEKKLFGIHFSALGSLYFKRDVPISAQLPLYDQQHDSEGQLEDDAFCIGPIADYMFWQDKGAELEIDRGPWDCGVDYLQAIARKEIQWTQKFGRPREPTFPHNTVGLGVQSPDDFVRLLNSYLALTPHLLPTDPSHPFNTPTLRHPDLTPANIMVEPDTFQITSLIDWQHSVIQPRILSAGYPLLFASPDEDFGPNLVEPKLPVDVNTLTEGKQKEEQELYRRRMLFYAYRVFNGAQNAEHISALRDPVVRLRQLLVEYAGRQWVGNVMTLKGALARTVEAWKHLPDVEGIRCPVQFDAEELREFKEKEEDWINMSFALEMWRARICNMNEDGWVRNEDFERAKEELKKVEEEVWGHCRGDQADERAFQASWPFRDHKE